MMANLIGQQFGNYRLVRLIGRGGFAEVYLGQHIHLSSQQAALKILSTRLDGQDIQAFIHEAETIATLIHPHIVRILDFAIQDQCPFLVMDYAPHGTLRQRHARGEQVPLPLVVSYAQQIAQGLAYAHEKKIVHRDIKPDNMLIDAQNKIVISDFGIATIAHNTSSHVSQLISGTVPYMAPEQFQGQLRPASDQYALAITLYEWLTGAYPFTGSFTEIAVKHATTAPAPLRAKCPTLPPQVEQVILTALAKDPKDRFVNVLAFANALEQASQMIPSMQPISTLTNTHTSQPSSTHLFIASNTPHRSINTHQHPTEAYLPPPPPFSPHVDTHAKSRKGPITMLVIGLLVLILLVIGYTSISAALQPGQSSIPPHATPVPTIIPTPTPMPTATPVPHLASVADFTTQPTQLANMTVTKNDASFQNDHSILGPNGHIVVEFPSQAGAKTVTLVIRALVSQSSPNQSGFSPLNILCNGQVIVSNYTVPGNGFDPNTTSIQVPMQELTNGTNQIDLQVTTSAQTFLWLYRVEVLQGA